MDMNEETIMPLNWSDLPPHVLDSVFKWFNVKELKFLSLVCRNWNYEIGRLLKGKVALIAPDCLQNYNDYTDYLQMIRRPYETLLVRNACIPAKIVRKIIKKTKVKHVQVQGRADNLIEILKATANAELTSLSVCFEDEFKSNHFSRMMKVSALRVQNVAPNFVNNFASLRSVQLSCRGDMMELLSALVQNNKSTLWELKLTGVLEDSLHLLGEFENLCSLSLMSLRPYSFPRGLKGNLYYLSLQNCSLTDEDITILKRDFIRLQVLELNFSEEKNITEKGLTELWNIKTLLHLQLIGFKFSNQVWLETFSCAANKNLKTLSFGSLDVDEEFIYLCAKYNPFLEELAFDSYFGSKIDLKALQILTTNLKKLKSLTLKDIEISQTNICDFKLSSESLEHLHISHRGLIPVDFFRSLETPSLKVLSLEFWKHKLTLEEVRYISKNCPKIENLKLLTFDDIHYDVIEALTTNSSNLRSLECNYLDMDGFLVVLRNCRFLSYAKLDVRLETDDINILLDKVAFFRLRMKKGDFSSFKFIGEKIEMDVKFLCKVLE
ncbi:hypothetical protein ACFFRR_002406 [Megaselia abdita]